MYEFNDQNGIRGDRDPAIRPWAAVLPAHRWRIRLAGKHLCW
jgi:hypothetical protein